MHYAVTIHESGHRPFGLADEYDGEGGYYQRVHHPNLYGSNSSYNIEFPFLEEGELFYNVGDRVPGCSTDPLLGEPGKPLPAAFTECESFTDDIVGYEWWRPEPPHSLMGWQNESDEVDGEGTVRVQAGPMSIARIQWYLNNCRLARC